MTGLECLREELRKKGFSAKQTESKTILCALEIISKVPDRYTDEDRLLIEIKQLETRKDRLQRTCEEYERKANVCKTELDSIVEKVNSIADENYRATKEYIASFFKALDDCETSAGRDAIKAAQMFVNSVNIDTKYDNTAFIIGLASILAQGNIASIESLRKVNKEIPEVYFEAEPFNRYNGGRSLSHYLHDYKIGTKGEVKRF